MARLGKVSQELNTGMDRIVEFLQKKGVQIENNPSAKISEEDYKLLRTAVRQRGVNIPPNVTAYITVTSQMIMFGTAVNRLMNNIEDTGILIPIDAIYHEKIKRHIGAYIRFIFAKRYQKKEYDTFEIEDKAIEHWISMRNRRVKRLFKRRGEKVRMVVKK